ncbi:ThiF family adenylyltransferase [Aeromonas hydrophila]|uniref:ThiF family adenylyltransferase n=1 Tax=Aeromonas hydrophila TaxID=644 RepID=UPI0038D1BBA4
MCGGSSLESQVAWQLARAGVGHVTLIDPVTLEAANVGRHVLGASDLGRTKVEALCKAQPTVQNRAYATFMEWMMADTLAVFELADLVIVTTAGWQSESILWRVKGTGKAWGLLQASSEQHTVAGHALFAPAGAFDAQYLFEKTAPFATRSQRGSMTASCRSPDVVRVLFRGGALA